MESGRARAPRPEGAGSRPRAAGRLARRAAACAAVCAILLGSCAEAREKRRLATFSSELAAIDALVAARKVPRLEAAFGRAYGDARSGSDWLSVLKRARAAEGAGDPGRYAKAAARAVKAAPRSAPVAMAAAHAYLRGGHPEAAFALFGAAIPPSAQPRLWAEAFVASRYATSNPPPATSADYGLLAETLGEPRAYLGAAVVSLIGSGRAADRLGAGAWLDNKRWKKKIISI